MKTLKDYFNLQKKVYDYFGYAEDWRVIPLEDATDAYWHLTGEGSGDSVCFSPKKEFDDEGCLYMNRVYTQRFLPKWVYRGEDYTMVCVDTHVDGNKFLQVFDNSKEVKELPEIAKQYL